MDADVSNSVFDRLVFDQSDRGEAGSSAPISIRESIARDLEVLLNSRRPADLIPAEYPECVKSVANFGVPEFDTFGNLSNPVEQQKLCAAFALAIDTFEPRLQNVTVRLLTVRERGSLLRFQIEGNLAVDGEPGLFVAGVTPHAGMVSVSAGGGA